VTPAYTHCPNCLTEHRAGSTICTVCGSLLVPGPAPILEPTEIGGAVGRIEVVRAGDPSEEPDRFALEEQEIGARRGEDTGEGAAEILIHAANLIDAQAVLVEFTGDVALVDDIAVDGSDDASWAVVTWVRFADAGVRANRLREGGLDVRLELPDGDGRDHMAAEVAILVAHDDLEEARTLLGIER
jgi:hypothetical protein